MNSSIIENRKNSRIFRNNIIAVLLSQVVIGIISYFTGATIISYLWGEMTENPSVLIGSVLLFVNVLFVLCLYFFAGRRFLKKTENKVASIISVWWLSLALIIFTVSGLLLKSDVLFGFMIFNPISLSIAFAFGAVKESSFDVNTGLFAFSLASFLPSFGLWLGTVIKKKNKAGRPKIDKSIPVV